MKRVFVLWKHPLFFEAVRLLLSHPQIDLSGAAYDDADSAEKIDDAHPELVILERSSSEYLGGADLLDYLGRNVRVVWLSLDDNMLSEFTRQNHTVVNRQDLLSLVLDLPSAAEE